MVTSFLQHVTRIDNNDYITNMIDRDTYMLLLKSTTLSFFYKQPVYKQLAFGWQIAKQLSGLKSPSLTNNKNYR